MRPPRWLRDDAHEWARVFRWMTTFTPGRVAAAVASAGMVAAGAWAAHLGDWYGGMFAVAVSGMLAAVLHDRASEPDLPVAAFAAALGLSMYVLGVLLGPVSWPLGAVVGWLEWTCACSALMRLTGRQRT